MILKRRLGINLKMSRYFSKEALFIRHFDCLSYCSILFRRRRCHAVRERRRQTWPVLLDYLLLCALVTVLSNGLLTECCQRDFVLRFVAKSVLPLGGLSSLIKWWQATEPRRQGDGKLT